MGTVVRINELNHMCSVERLRFDGCFFVDNHKHANNNEKTAGRSRAYLSVARRSVIEARRVTDERDTSDDDGDVGDKDAIRLMFVAR